MSSFSNFWKVLFHPQETIQYVLDRNLNYGVFPILMIGLSLFLLGPDKNHIPYVMNNGLAYILVSIPIFLVIKLLMYWIVALLLCAIGKFWNGTATPKELFKAVIWSAPPDLIGKAFFIIAEAVFTLGPFESSATNTTTLDLFTIFHYGFRVLASGMALWGMAISVIILSKVQRFSIIKSIVSVVIYMALMTGIYSLTGKPMMEVIKNFFVY